MARDVNDVIDVPWVALPESKEDAGFPGSYYVITKGTRMHVADHCRRGTAEAIAALPALLAAAKLAEEHMTYSSDDDRIPAYIRRRLRAAIRRVEG